MSCVFCDIVERKSKSEIIFENEHIISFLDIHPVSYGHTLIITKKHFDSILDVPGDLLSLIMKDVQTLAKKINKSLPADGFNLVANSGSAAGQSVFHFHLHIIPRLKKDDFKFNPKFIHYTNDEFRGLGSKLRSFINNEVV
ncbi:MAG: HIT family protein [Bacteroidota bacterium]|nr:HIT family protein [Bacteroidota bacterium]